MNYWEKTKMFEKAFLLFLLKLKKREKLKIIYQLRIARIRDRDCSYIGYLTQKGGYHGIHYSNQTGTFYFGTRDKRHRLRPRHLDNLLKEHIPKQIREWMKRV